MHRTFLSRSQERPFASRARLDAVNQTLPLRIFLFVSIGVAALIAATHGKVVTRRWRDKQARRFLHVSTRSPRRPIEIASAAPDLDRYR